MVLLAAAVSTRGGKTLMSRQFVEMSKARTEGLLAAFPKLLPSGVKQHTFLETDSVRYVYQPMDKLYMLLITTKTSNILEDLETLRLFARVIPEYCRSLDEADILENAFQIVFAFDEIVALGYRESVNLAQIRTFVEMDSHEEKVYQAVRQTQEREAKQKMREKAKELQRAKMEAAKRGGRPLPGGYTSMSGGFSSGGPAVESLSTPAEPPKPTFTPSNKPSYNSRALKLGGKTNDVDSFVDQLVSEGEHVSRETVNRNSPATKSSVPSIPQVKVDNIHVKIEEKISVTAGRDGGLRTLELTGMLTLRITEEKFGRIKLSFEGPNNNLTQLQPHPNIDKELLKSKSIIALKNPTKPFPANTDVGVLKWRFVTSDESFLPLSINCWPSDNSNGGCDVNIEYALEREEFELQDVVITIPIPHASSPIVSQCDGEYSVEKRGSLSWQLPVIDTTNKTGSMEFTCNGSPDDFFPVKLSFYTKKSFVGLRVLDCLDVEKSETVKHSSELVLLTEKYEVV